MRDCGIWLSFDNQREGFRIPVNPSSIEISEGGSGKSYHISGLGEINVIQSPNLTEIEFESIFPAFEYPFVVDKYLREPKYYINRITKWMATERPIRFVFVSSSVQVGPLKDTKVDINIPASIERFDWKESAGVPGEIEYKLSLKKYVFYSAKKVLNFTDPGADRPVLQADQPVRPSERQTPSTYILVAGDNLWKIAKNELGDGSRWKGIQELNGISDAQLKNLPAGMELRLPVINDD